MKSQTATEMLFRYCIFDPKTCSYLAAKNQWGKQENALHFISNEKANNRAFKLKINCEIHRVSYKRTGNYVVYQYVVNIE